jgi:purine-nucleoside phosphorylase
MSAVPDPDGRPQNTVTTGSDPTREMVESFRRLAGLPQLWRPAVAIVLGSGLGGTADRLLKNSDSSQNSRNHLSAVNASAIPGLAPSHVAGHRGQFAAGFVNGIPVVFQQGRIHAYEGHSVDAVTATVRLFRGLGCQTLILTNAAGGIHPNFRPGDVMLIRDHLRMPANLTVACTSLPTLGNSPRCPWTPSLLNTAFCTPGDLQVHSGTYAMMPGPAYETPAEVRMLRSLGADAVGMSTVPEALQAAALDMQVLGISCITNVAAGLQNQTLSHSEVTDTASRIEAAFASWLKAVLLRITPNTSCENTNSSPPFHNDSPS